MSGAGLEPATFWVPDGESRGGVPFLLDTPLIVGYHLSYPYLASLTPTLCVIGQACPPTAGSSPVSRSNCDEAEVGPGPDPFLLPVHPKSRTPGRRPQERIDQPRTASFPPAFQPNGIRLLLRWNRKRRSERRRRRIL